MLIFYYIMITVFLLLGALLCLIIMMQEGKGSSLGAFLGGGQDSLFGVSTAQVLKKITAYMATIFMILSLLLSFWTASIGKNISPYSQPQEQVEETTNDN